MKADTKKARMMQRVLINHLKRAKWLVVALKHQGVQPEIAAIRITQHETVMFLRPLGILHDPKLSTLREYGKK